MVLASLVTQWRRFRAGALLTALGVAVAGLAPAAAAVEIKLGTSSDPSVTLVEISGRFERGDAQVVQTFLAGLPKGRQVAVNLASPGGLIDEALRIGRHFHANSIRTQVVGAGRDCLSACALAFLGGREASGRSYRVKGSEARIGFHSFRQNVPDKEFTVGDMHEAVAGTQQVLLVIADYLTAVDANIEFMSLMLDKPNSDMNFLSNEKAPSIGVHVLQERTGRLVVPAGAGR